MFALIDRSKRCIFLILYTLSLMLLPAPAIATDSAVILMYHRFDESRYPTTNTTIEQFKAHLAELRAGNYDVKPIPEILATIRSGKKFAKKTIGISIDDAFLSVYKVGWPMLREANFPVTLFVATKALDRKGRNYMSWDQLREMVRAGVTIGSQTASHLHMPLTSAEQNLVDLKASISRFKSELGIVPNMIAYPYGEYSLAVNEVVRAAGFKTGFGQHSGAIYKNSNFFYLPRFTFNENYGGIRRFRLAVRSLPLKVKDLTPIDPYLKGQNNPPLFGFTFDGESTKNLSQLACYATGFGRIRIERLGERRIEARASKPFRPGRTRLNCTLPEENGRWRWLGMQFLVPQ